MKVENFHTSIIIIEIDDLRKENLNKETEFLSAQNNAIRTNYMEPKIDNSK